MVKDEEVANYMAEASQHSHKSDHRIEIVEWADDESSHDQNNSGSSSISLSHVMMGGSTGAGDNCGDKLTIDNLWKILACEKPVNPETQKQIQKPVSRSRKDDLERGEKG
jgi:hypothetical protein